MASIRVLIAGGGIGGLTLAHGLTYPLMELASDHGNFGGGGLRGRPCEEVTA